MKEMTPAVHVVDDDRPFLRALARLLRAEGYEVMAHDSPDAFLAAHSPATRGCAVVDLQMPGRNGLELQHALAASENPLPVIFLTGTGDIPSSVRAMKQGAEDFLTKMAPKEELLSAVSRALARDAAESRQRQLKVERGARFRMLSTREQEVLSHVVRGELNKQIAGALGTCERTIKLHRTAITTKLGVRSVAELVGLWTDWKASQPLGVAEQNPT